MGGGGGGGGGGAEVQLYFPFPAKKKKKNEPAGRLNVVRPELLKWCTATLSTFTVHSHRVRLTGWSNQKVLIRSCTFGLSNIEKLCLAS